MDFQQTYVDGEIVIYRLAISKQKSLQQLGVLSNVRSLTSGVHEMHIICINILSMKLRLETISPIHVRESSDLCFIMKVSKIDLFEKLILVQFLNNRQMD